MEWMDMITDKVISVKKSICIPSCIAGIAMKHLFAGNELTRRIMTLHNDIGDIMYGCNCVYDEGKRQGIDLPLFYKNMDKIKATL